MPFPALTERLKSFLPDSTPISLNLKSGDPTLAPQVAWYAQNGYNQIASQIASWMPAWSGEVVSRQTALQHSAVWACNQIVSESIGFIPADLMRSVRGEKADAAEHPMFLAMKNAPNDEISAQGFREMLTSHCLLSGGGFAKIIRRSGTNVAIGLEHLLPEQVTPDREKTGQKRLVYVIKNEMGAVDKTYTIDRGKPHDILHIRGLGWDGIRGYDVITLGRQSIGSAIAAEKHAATFWANGGRIPYVVELEKKFASDPDFDKYRADLEKMASQPNKPMIAEMGAKIKNIGLNMVESQAIEFRLAVVAEIGRWFSVSPHLINDLSHATFSNIENLALQFEKMTLARWLRRWEQDFWRCVLTPDEKTQGYFLNHNINAFVRGDLKTRMESYASALQNGHMNVDEVRDLEDRNKLPNGAGQAFRFQFNMQTTPGTGEPTIAEQRMLAAATAKKPVAATAAGD